jgi:hypothetical protein
MPRWIAPGWLLLALTALPAAAADIDFDRQTPHGRRIEAEMRRRQAELQSYLMMGQLGIDRDGMLVVRSTAGVPARVLAEMQRLSAEENAARRALIAEAKKANGIADGKQKDLDREFAKRWRAAAARDWSVQDDDGRWRQGPPR